MSRARRQRADLLTFVCWKWRQPGYRSRFEAEHVNTLHRMIARNYPRPHRFICVTDDATGLDDEVQVVPLWYDHGSLTNASWAQGPSCYRRLRLFAPDAHELLGVPPKSRVVSMDLDAVVCDDLRPLFDRPESFVMWRGTSEATPYNGSMLMLELGSRPQVWERFDPERTRAETLAAGLFGSDQAVISLILGPHEATWDEADGVFGWRYHCRKMTAGEMPDGARLVFFHGKQDPWDPEILYRRQWVADRYW